MSLLSQQIPSVRNPDKWRGQVPEQAAMTLAAPSDADLSLREIEFLPQAAFQLPALAAKFEDFIAEQMHIEVGLKKKPKPKKSKLDDLSEPELAVVMIMQGDMFMPEIADKMDKHIGYIAKVVKRLYSAGHITRIGDVKPYKYRLAPELFHPRNAKIKADKMAKIKGACERDWLTAHQLRDMLGFEARRYLEEMADSGVLNFYDTQRGVRFIRRYGVKV